MLAKYLLAGVAGSAMLASVAFAQAPTATSDSTKMAPAAASDTSSSFQGDWRASKVVGLSVYNDKNESVGSMPAMPCSPNVGTSGSVGERSRPVTARSFICLSV